MNKREVKVGSNYLCTSTNFSWSFVGKAVSKKEDNVKIKVLKCHPGDRSNMSSDNPILDVNYLSVIEDI